MELYPITDNQRRLIDILESMNQTDMILMTNGGELTPELEERADQDAKDLPAKIDGYNAVLRNTEGQISAIDAEIKRLQEIKKGKENAVKNLKNYLAYVMKASGVQKIEGTLCKVSFRKSTSVEVNEDEVLSPFMQAIQEMDALLPSYLKLDVKISKTDLKNAINAGEPVKGAQIVENENLTIK